MNSDIQSIIDRAIAGAKNKPNATVNRPFIPPSPRWRDFYLGLDETAHPEVAAMCAAVERWAKGCLSGQPDGRLIVIIGRNGVGKSTAARGAIHAIKVEAIDAWHRGLWPKHNPPRADWWAWSDLANIGANERNADTSWPEATSLDAVLLDDVGSELDPYKSNVPIENLRLILEARCGLWTCITTNVPPEAWEEVWDARVASRLHENAVRVELRTAPDWRRK
jgi:hypothetical protein